MECLIECADGDLRKSVTYLQTAHSLKGEEEIDKSDVLKITGVSFCDRFQKQKMFVESTAFERNQVENEQHIRLRLMRKHSFIKVFVIS